MQQKKIKTIKPDFALTPELNEKYLTWKTAQEDNNGYNNYNDRDEHDFDRDTFEALTDGDYDGWRDGGGDFDEFRDGPGY